MLNAGEQGDAERRAQRTPPRIQLLKNGKSCFLAERSRTPYLEGGSRGHEGQGRRVGEIVRHGDVRHAVQGDGLVCEGDAPATACGGHKAYDINPSWNSLCTWIHCVVGCIVGLEHVFRGPISHS